MEIKKMIVGIQGPPSKGYPESVREKAYRKDWENKREA
jgi:hypothetical protein